jgi:hypothetical protein
VPLEQAIVGRQCQQYPQGAVTHNRWEDDVSVVCSFTLEEAFGDKACAVPCDDALLVNFDLEDPLGRQEVPSVVRGDDLPGAVGEEGTLLLLHGGYPLGRIGTAHGFSIGDRLLERHIKTLVEVVIGLRAV